MAWALGVAMLAALPVAAALAAPVVFPLQGRAEVRWLAPEQAQVWGMPLVHARFESDWTVPRLADALVQEANYWQVFTQLPGRLMLSGQTAQGHWLAQLTETSEGSRGQVSLWRVPAAAAQVPDSAILGGLLNAPWLGAPLMHVRFEEQGQTIEQLLLPVALGQEALSEMLSTRLLAAQWQLAQASAQPWGEQRWCQSGRSISWRHYRLATGSAVFIHYTE